MTTLLLGACTASTGIVDNFVPPQGQPQVESRTGYCAEPVPITAAGKQPGQEVHFVPCLVESVAALAGARPARPQRDASRPGRIKPPRFPRLGR